MPTTQLTGKCLTAEEIYALANEEVLFPQRETELIIHCDNCEACQGWLDYALRDQLETESRATNMPFGFKLSVGGIATLVLAGLLVWWLFTR
jgi:hypothetical protein